MPTTQLNPTAREALQAAGIDPDEWLETYGGDACGCWDSRCISHHHDDEPCQCLPVCIGQHFAEQNADDDEPTDRAAKCVYRSANVVLNQWPGSPIKCEVAGVTQFTSPDELDALARELTCCAIAWRNESATAQPTPRGIKINGKTWDQLVAENMPLAEFHRLCQAQGVSMADVAASWETSK